MSPEVDQPPLKLSDESHGRKTHCGAAEIFQSAEVAHAPNHRRSSAVPLPEPKTATTPAWWERRSSVALLCVALYALLLGSIWNQGVTFDEPRHATAGYAYWTLGDYRLDPETGVLANLVAAAPLLLVDNPFPSLDSDAWRSADERRMGDLWFNQSQADVITFVRVGRACAALFAVALAAIVWFYGRNWGGSTVAALAVALFALNPTVLANGALMTSDLLASGLFLTSIVLIWRLTQEVTLARLSLSALSAAALFAVKNSALSLIPVAAILVGLRLVSPQPLTITLLGHSRVITSRLPRFLNLVGLAIVHVVVGWALIWTFYGFRFAAFSHPRPDERFPVTWEEILGRIPPAAISPQLALTPEQSVRIDSLHLSAELKNAQWTPTAALAFDALRSQILTPTQIQQLDRLLAAFPANVPQRVFHFFLQRRLLPEGYLFGLSQTWFYSHGYPSFLNGAVNLDGSPFFFPYTFWVKTPLPTLLLVAATLLVAALISLTPGRSGEWQHTAPLWVFIATYTGICLFSRLNIGHRHLLPLYAPLCLLIATYLVPRIRLMRLPARRWSTIAVATLVAVQAGEILYRFPHYLAYFNGIVSPARGYEHLVDSSLDWGQELPAVGTYLAKNQGNGRNYLAYFGLDRPEKYGIKAAALFSLPGYFAEEKLFRGRRITAQNARAESASVAQEFPDYEIAGTSLSGEFQDLLLLRTADAMQLGEGVYVIGATMLQPVYFKPWSGQWNESYEADYQRLRAEFLPFLNGAGPERARLLAGKDLVQLQTNWQKFREVRFARLTAFLQAREPDAQINYSVLVYHLSARDVAAALDGPSPANPGKTVNADRRTNRKL